MVAAQIYYNHGGSIKKPSKKISKKDQPKTPSQNGQVQINLSKMALWSSWTWGQKKNMGFFLIPKFLVKKIKISCNVVAIRCSTCVSI
jgi:hypothetical protein